MIDLNTVAQFTWMWNCHFFLQTDEGNFIWSDPEYQGDDTIVPYNGSYKQFCEESHVEYGRCKGKHTIGEYCGPNVEITQQSTLVKPASMATD